MKSRDRDGASSGRQRNASDRQTVRESRESRAKPETGQAFSALPLTETLRSETGIALTRLRAVWPTAEAISRRICVWIDLIDGGSL